MLLECLCKSRLHAAPQKVWVSYLGKLRSLLGNGNLTLPEAMRPHKIRTIWPCVSNADSSVRSVSEDVGKRDMVVQVNNYSSKLYLHK